LLTTCAPLGGGQTCVIDAFVDICFETQVVVKSIDPYKNSTSNTT
jgi:hypothetical protein